MHEIASLMSDASRNCPRSRHSLSALSRRFLTPWRSQRHSRSRGWAALALLVLVAGVLPRPAVACPFCESVQQTIRQQSLTMDAVAIASCLDGELTRNLTTGVVKMKIEKVLKGGDHIKKGETVDAIYYGKVDVGRRFLLSGVDPPNLQWSCLPVTERAEEYIVKASQVGEDPVAQLRFFRDYLENEETLISRDAYDEFASAPYEVIRKIGHEMDREQLIEWVKQPEIGADRKRLYFTLLGICGTKEDLPMLEAMLRNPAKSVTGGLDALIACYLTLAGEEGLPLVDELFIDNKKAPFPQSYAAIMAIRFHGTEGGVIARSALVDSLHKVLDREELADMVIPDLAKWKDWSQVERLVQLFKEAEKDKNWLRVPVINYLRACPLPEAAAAIDELEKIDPDAVRRAKTFFPIPVPVREKPSEQSTSQSAGPAVGRDVAELGPAADHGIPHRRYAALAAAEPVGGVIAESRILAEPMNPWDLGYVLLTALVSIVLLLFLVLTGGPATGQVASA